MVRARHVLLAAAAMTATTYLVTLGRVIRADFGQRRTDPSLSADAIVVLGGKVFPDRPSLEVRLRLDHAEHLWRSGVAPDLIMTGGLDSHLDEARIMADHLAGHGVPAERIAQINTGHNTRTSLQGLTADRTYVLVSSRYHAHRLQTEARRVGLSATTSCAPSSPEVDVARTHLTRLQEETLACILYAAPAPVARMARHLIGDLRYTLPHVINRQSELSLPERLRNRT